MMGINFNILGKFRYIFYSFIFSIVIFSFSNAQECVIAADMGSSYQVIIKANPTGLSNDQGFTQNTLSQRAAWVDSGVFTDGDPSGFYFEITGSWTPWYNDLDNQTLLADETDYCALETVNGADPDNRKIGIYGEFDYINSAYSLLKTNTFYTKLPLSPENQRQCWLTTGEGLYIAFFGANGYKLPEIATHLKTSVISCDKEYATDKNGDGIITLNECYDVKDSKQTNKAYYVAYRSEYLRGDVKCNKDYFHGSDINKIGINDCYEEVKSKSGIITKENRIRFAFETPYLYKKRDKTRIGKNEKVKFIIYDRYYSDNKGQYIINMYRGISDMKDPGLIEKIIRDLENVFVGTRDNKGNMKGGILIQFYNYIVKDVVFSWAVRAMILLYITFLGLQFAMGSLQYNTKELMTILLKLTFVLGFTTTTSWKFYDRFIVQFFLDGFANIIVMIANITNKIFDPTAGNLISGTSLSSKFAFIDNLIMFLFSSSITNKIQGLFFGVWFGFVVIPIFYILIIYYIVQLVNSIFPYLIMFIQAILALVVGPIFISFYLFKTTQHMFKNWLAFVGARFANMAFLFLFIFSFASIIKNQFQSLLTFEVCKTSFWDAIFTNSSTTSPVANFFSFGGQVWDAHWTKDYPEPEFVSFCISLFFIGILIYLFGEVIKKIPKIVDSLISIDGESGGASTFGKGEATFTGMLNSDIKIGDAKGRETGIIDKFKGIGGDFVKKGVAWFARNTVGAPVAAAYNKLNDLYDQNKIYDSIQENDLKGKNAVNFAVDEYKNGLKKDKNLSLLERDEKTRAFKNNMEEKYIKDPIRSEMKNTYKDFKTLTENGGYKINENDIDKLAKDRMNEFYNREFAGTPEEYSPYLQNSSILKSMKFSGNPKVSNLPDYKYEKMKREFNFIRASERVGTKYNNINDYNKSVADKLNSKWGIFKTKTGRYGFKGEFANGDSLELNAKTNREALDLERKSTRESYANSMKKQYRLSIKEATKIAKEKQNLLDKLESERKNQETANLDKELERMNRIKQNSNYKNSKNEVDKQIEDLNKRKSQNSEIAKLKAEMGKTNSESVAKKLAELKNSKVNYNDLMERSDKITEQLGGSFKIISSSIDKEKEKEFLNKEIERLKNSNTSQDRLTKLQELSKKQGEAEKLNKTIEDSKQAEEKEKMQTDLEIKNKQIEEERKRLLAESDKDSLYNKNNILDQDKEGVEIKDMQTKINEMKENSSIDSDTISKLDGQLKLLQELEELKKSDNFESIDKIRDSIIKGELEINEQLNGINHLKDNEILSNNFEKIHSEIEKLTYQDQELVNDMNNLVLESQNISNISLENGQYNVSADNVNLAVSGIDAETFGIQGIKGLGLGEDNDDILGFGKGASSLILGSDFTDNDNSKNQVDTVNLNITRMKLKMASQEGRVLQFQLAQAKADNNEKEITEIDNQLKQNKKQIRILEDDINEA